MVNYFVIADIHAQAGLLKSALKDIETENGPSKVIFLGDYIDRGPDNVEVLDTVMNPKEGWEFVCLMGNHEHMLVQGHIYDYNAVEELNESENGLFHYTDWMASLPFIYREGNNIFTHAWYDTSVRYQDQDPAECMWERFMRKDGFNNDEGLFLTHGHTPQKSGEPLFIGNRANLDVGSFFNHKLCVGVFEEGKTGIQDWFIVES